MRGFVARDTVSAGALSHTYHHVLLRSCSLSAMLSSEGRGDRQAAPFDGVPPPQDVLRAPPPRDLLRAPPPQDLRAPYPETCSGRPYPMTCSVCPHPMTSGHPHPETSRRPHPVTCSGCPPPQDLTCSGCPHPMTCSPAQGAPTPCPGPSFSRPFPSCWGKPAQRTLGLAVSSSSGSCAQGRGGLPHGFHGPPTHAACLPSKLTPDQWLLVELPRVCPVTPRVPSGGPWWKHPLKPQVMAQSSELS